MGPLSVVAAPETRKLSRLKRAESLRRLVRGMGEWIDARPARAFLMLTMVYATAVCTLSSIKLLWLDELITLHIARLGSIADIWHALAQGADPNPPLTVLLVRWSREVFGEHELSLRLPAMAGYWLGMLSLFTFLRRRIPATWALAGAMLSMTMASFEYSYESRSYGIFYGLCMAAVLCWSITADPATSRVGRWWSLVGMVAALAAGISTNYFAVLAFLPIAAGEVAHTVLRIRRRLRLRRDMEGWGAPPFRAIDLRIWIGLLLAAAPLLAFRTLIATSIARFAPHAWNKVSWGQMTDSYTEMVEAVLYPLLALIVFTVLIRLMGHLCSYCRASIRPRWMGELATEARRSCDTVPLHEAVAILFLMGYPILGYAVASIYGGMLSPRFVIPVCFGFAAAATLAAFRILGHLRGAGVLMLCLCAAWFVARESVIGYWYMEQRQSFYKVVDRLPQAEEAVPPGAPIVIPDPLLVLTFRHYAPAAYASRVVIPEDFPAIRLYRGDDSPDENLWAGRGWVYSAHILPLAVFQRVAGKYLIIASDGNWLVQDLLWHHYPVQRLAINTRAGAIGGFTPLCRGTPVFFTSAGGAYLRMHPATGPMRFEPEKNLPSGE